MSEKKCRFCEMKGIRQLIGGGYMNLEMIVDTGNPRIIASEFEDAVYYPKFCPECGRKLLSDEDIYEMRLENIKDKVRAKSYELERMGNNSGAITFTNEELSDILALIDNEKGRMFTEKTREQ